MAISDPSFLWAAGVIVLALAFTFTNGFHDSATQVAGIIASRALSPETALVLAALANFAGAWALGTGVAKTILSGIVNPLAAHAGGAGPLILASALLSAVAWNIITWRLGLPTSSSHALIGGLVGAFWAAWGGQVLLWGSLRMIILVMLLSPLAGFAVTYLFTKLTFFFTQWASPRIQGAVNVLQVLSLLGQSLAHGANDAQKSMGLILFTLMLIHPQSFDPSRPLAVPAWVTLSCALSITLGTMSGGWRIIRKLSAGLYRIRSLHSAASQAASGGIMVVSSLWGFPVSTTQIVSSSLMGAGAAFRPKAVRWAVARDMAAAWLITIPLSAALAALAFKALYIFVR